jgi:hypothetical protein
VGNGQVDRRSQDDLQGGAGHRPENPGP